MAQDEKEETGEGGADREEIEIEYISNCQQIYEKNIKNLAKCAIFEIMSPK